MATRSLVRARRPVVPPGRDRTSTGHLGASQGFLGGGGGGAWYWPGGSQWPTGVPYAATPATVAGLPAAARALNMLSGIICQLPLLSRRADGTFWDTPPVLDDPWPMSGRAEWI